MKNVIPSKKQSPILGLTGMGGGVGGNLSGGGPAAGLGVDEVFRIDGYKGLGSQDMTLGQGLDMTEGGMLFSNPQNSVQNKVIATATMGAGYRFEIDSNGGAGIGFYTSSAGGGGIGSQYPFTTNGVIVKGDNNSAYNNSSLKFSHFVFRNAKKFFNEFEYTGNGVSGRQIAHNLGSTPAMIWVKGNSKEWRVMHTGSSLYSSGGYSWRYWFRFGSSQDTSQSNNENLFRESGGDLTDTHFTVGNATHINDDGQTYRCMVFASNEAAFGPDGDKVISKAGTYTGNGGSGGGNGVTNGTIVNLGWEPQFVLVKRRDHNANWMFFDKISRVTEDTNQYHRDKLNYLAATSGGQTDPWVKFTDTGFQWESGNDNLNYSSHAYIYYAIRKDDGATSKVPTAGTECFDIDVANSSQEPNYQTTMRPDFFIAKENVKTDGSGDWQVTARHRGGHRVRLESNHEGDDLGSLMYWGWAHKGGISGLWNHDHNYAAVGHAWKVGTGFDMVQYVGNGSAATHNHNLGGIPEMMWVRRWHVGGGNSGWNIYTGVGTYGDGTKYWDGFATTISTGNSRWDNTAPTDTTFRLGTSNDVCANNLMHTALLFRSITGVSKIGTYTGDGTDNRLINVGFQPRWLLLKNFDSPSDWCVYFDNWDYFLRYNSNGARIAQSFVTQDSSGFQVDNGSASGNNFNSNGENIFYYAHA
tara:strand:- start:190 stop:2277 length:2088 start_codon:yes stop_codon:yes gene_type:complete